MADVQAHALRLFSLDGQSTFCVDVTSDVTQL